MRTIDLGQKVTAVYFDDGRGEWHREATTVEELLQGNIDEDIHAISHDLPTIEQRWIPCSEKMPMQGTEVLVCDKDGFLSIAEYEWIDGEIWWRETTEYRHIEGGAIAWMPLPEPYKGEEG